MSTQAELNAVELGNILRAQEWLKAYTGGEILTERFIRDLHRRMLADVWSWAGSFSQWVRARANNCKVTDEHISKLRQL